MSKGEELLRCWSLSPVAPIQYQLFQSDGGINLEVFEIIVVHKL